MEAVKIISKAAMPTPAYRNDCVSAKQLMVIEEGGERKLIVKFSNTRGEPVDEIVLSVDKFGEKGDLIGTEIIECEKVDGAAKRSFTLNRKFALPKETASCKVKVVSARYGDYVYTPSGKNVNVAYSPKSWEGAEDKTDYKAKTGRKGIALTRRSLKMPALIMTVTLIAMALALGSFIGYIQIYKATHDSFLYGTVQYTFVSESEDSDVYITGFRGNRTTIEIPEEIEGHKVRGISAGAFANNSRVQKITVGGEVTVGPRAFFSCTSLKEINLENVTEIGYNAFYGCASLKSVTLDKISVIDERAFYGCTSLEKVTVSKSDDTLEVGAAAFGGCTALRSADISRSMTYEYGDSAPFAGSYSVESLHIKDFSGEKVTAAGIAALFGVRPAQSSDIGNKLRLKELKIDEIDFIPYGFVAGMPVETVEIGKVETPRIEARAFDGCTFLASVTVPVNIEYVGNDAFSGTSLIYFNGTDLKHIGENAFKDCAKLTTFTPCTSEEIDAIGAGAFAGCASLTSFTVPARVTVIRDDTFGGCASLTNITFAGGNSITEIGAGAFAGCTSLTRLDMPTALKKIGDRAFEGCRVLWEFALPETLEDIGDDAFSGCLSLSKLTLPSSLEHIGKGAFARCDNLSELSVPFIGGSPKTEENSYFAYIFGAESYKQSSEVLPKSLDKVLVRGSASVPKYAFAGCASVRQVSFLGDVISVGERAFADCSSLGGLTFTEALVEIGSGAFAGCSFESFTVPAGVTSIGAGVFENCASLSELTLPFIGGSAKSNTYLSYLFGSYSDTDGSAVSDSLKKVNVTVQTAVPARAFYGCSLLQSVTLCNELSSIGNSAFYNCASIEEIALPETLATVGDYAFGGCASLKEITFPEGVTSLGKRLLEGCTSLSSLTTPFVGSGDGPIGGTLASMFGGDNGNVSSVPRSLEKVTLTATTNLPAYAFDGCGYLRTVVLGDKIKTIGLYAFRNCRSIRNIILPETLTDIMTDAFDGCHFLYEIYNHSPLEITPKSAAHGKVAYYALVVHSDDGDKLDTFESGGFEFVLDRNDYPYLMGIVSDAKQLTMPATVTNEGKTYETYSVWARFMEGNDYVTGMTVSSSVVEMGERAFADCTALETVSFTANRRLGSIETEMFTGCTSLKSVGLPQKITSIANNAFYGCTSLERITVPEGVTSIGMSAFEGCTSLVEAELPESLTVLQPALFKDCESLIDVRLSSSELSIGSYAFFGCKELRSLTTEQRGNKAIVRSVGDQAFAGCRSLSRIAISASAQSSDMGFWSFLGCDKLHEVWDLGSLGITAGSSSFGFVGSNAYVVHSSIDSELEYFKTGGLHFINYDGWRLVDYFGTDESVTLESFTFGEEEVCAFSIEQYAFREIETLKRIASKGVKMYILYGAFYGCESLESLELDTLGAGIYEAAFIGSPQLKTVEISAPLDGETGVTLMPYAFEDSRNIESLILGGGTVTVERNALPARDKLAILKISANEAILNEYAFYGSSALINLEISFGGSLTVGANAFAECRKTETVHLTGSGDISIESEAFYNSRALTSLDIKAENIEIGDSAFAQCESIEKLSLVGVGKIGIFAFGNCMNLKTLTIEGSLTEIGVAAFSGCGFLEEVYLPDTLEVIGDSAFAGCSSLRKITLPKALKEVRSYAFTDCGSLEVLNVGDALEMIGDNAFYGCSALKELTLPDSLTYIGNFVFSGAESLETLKFGKNLSTLGIGAFRNSRALKELILPDSLTVIGQNAFFEAVALESLTLPSGLERIEANAFYNCSELKFVSLPRTLAYIGDNAFYNARSLFAVHNESSLNISQLSYNFGAVGYYALVISSLRQHTELRYAEFDGYKFVFSPLENMWYLYGMPEIGYIETLYLPRELLFEDKAVTSYNIKNFTLSSKMSIGGIVIPSAVKKIEVLGFDGRFFSDIYFEGKDWDEFYTLTGNVSLGYGGVHYYNGCKKELHPYYWNYDKNGKVNMDWVFPTEFETLKEATCIEYGEQQYVCDGCGYVWTNMTAKLEHQYDENGVCIKCGTEKATADNFEKLTWLENDEDNPFTFNAKDGRIQSTNKADDSSSRLRIVTHTKRNLCFFLTASSMQGDYAEVRINGVTEFTATGASFINFERVIDEGDVVEIVYRKDNKGSSRDDCIYISNLRLESLELMDPDIGDVGNSNEVTGNV